MNNIIKLVVAGVLLLSTSISYAAQVTTTTECSGNECVTTETSTFVLNLWAPDEVAPEGATYAEIGAAYQYQYNPEEVEFNHDDSIKMVKFKFADHLSERYQFRWLTASEPSAVTLEKMKANKMRVKIDANSLMTPVYFEVWVLDTETGERFMCDPQVKIRA